MELESLLQYWWIAPVVIITATPSIAIYIGGYGFAYTLGKKIKGQVRRILFALTWPISLVATVAVGIVAFCIVFLQKLVTGGPRRCFQEGVNCYYELRSE